jgi:hypothetical protein
MASSRWYWVLLSCGILFDAAAATVAVCLAVLPQGTSARATLSLAAWCPAWAAALTASTVLLVQAWGRLPRFLEAAGVAACVGVALAAGWPSTIGGPAGWTVWLAGLLVAAALLLQFIQREHLLLFAAACTASLLLPFASRLPTTGGPSPWELLGDGLLRTIRTLTLALGGATLLLTWMSANLALMLVLLGPTRRGSIRQAASGAYRALALAVALLALGALLGSWPLRFPRDTVLLSVLAVTVCLLHARFAAWVQDIGLTMSCALLGAGLLCGSEAWLAALGAPPAALGWLAVGALGTISLLLHATHRYCFDCVEKGAVS